MVQRTLPAQISSTVLRYVSDFAQQATRLTAAGLIFLGLAALAMIMTVDRVLNDIWQVRERRPFSQRVLIYWALITLGPILIGASLTASSYLWALSEDAIALMPRWLRSLIDFAPVILSGLAYCGTVRVRAESHRALARCTDRRLRGRHTRGNAEVRICPLHQPWWSALDLRRLRGAAAFPVVDVPVLVCAAVRCGHCGHRAAPLDDALRGRVAGGRRLCHGHCADPAAARGATAVATRRSASRSSRAALAPIRSTPSDCSSRSNGCATCAGCRQRVAAASHRNGY